jgi:hypothetical protein
MPSEINKRATLYSFKVLLNRINIAFKLTSEKKIIIVWENIKTRLYSTKISLGLERDLNNEFKKPKSLIDFSIRLWRDSDINSLNESYRHIRLVKANIPNCYVAVTKDNIPIFRQWLIGSSENNQIKNYFGDLYPKLKKNEALIEGAFTSPSYRGFGIMPLATASIAEKGKEIGVDNIITFVDIKNISSLRSVVAAGFVPYTLRKERWIFLFRKVDFLPISEEVYALYNKYTANLKINQKIN